MSVPVAKVIAADVASSAIVVEEVDKRDPTVRLSALLDTGSMRPCHPADDSGVLAATGSIDGVPVVAYCTDGARMGGAMGIEGCAHIVNAIDFAVRERRPVIGLWHSGGAKLAQGVEALHGVGGVFAAMVRASGRVPQVSVVLGPAAGGAAYGPALTDVVIMARGGKVFVTGPDVVRSVTGEDIDMEGLGGAEAHGTRSGVVHQVVDSEPEAYAHARSVVGLLAKPGLMDLGALGDSAALADVLPESARRAYDVRPLVYGLVDGGRAGFEELQARWAPNIVTGLGRIAHRAVGVIANNPLRKGGCLDSLSAEKSSRFVRMCDAFGVPLLVLVDVPGYLPGVGQEWGGVVRRGAKLLHAFAEATVPRVTLVTRKSYGGAYIAMNSRALGATRVFAWPSAEVAVMGAEAAVKVLHRKKLAAVADDERPILLADLVAEHERCAGGLDRGIELGVIDEVIEPSATRAALAEAIAAAPPGRGAHGNIPL